MKIIRRGVFLSALALLLCFSLTGCVLLPGVLDRFDGAFEEGGTEDAGEEDGIEDAEEPEETVEDHDATPADFIFDENDPTLLVGVRDTTCSLYEIPAGTRRIGTDAFYDCSYARAIHLPEGLTEIGERAFGFCTALREVNFPSSLTRIEASAFEYCERLSRVLLPESVSYLGEYAFSDCRGVRELVIPAGTEVADASALEGCRPAYVTLPAHLLEWICLEDALTVTVNGGETIPENTLSDASNLTSLTLFPSLREAEGLYFSSNKLVEIYDFSEIGISRTEYEFYNERLEIYTSPEEKSHLFRDGDFLFYEKEDARYLMGYAGGDTELLTLPESCHGETYEVHDDALLGIGVYVEGISVPAAVTAIGDFAFRCLPITRVLFAEDGMLRVIGNSAFEEVELDALTLPASLEWIGESAFWRCLNLRRVSFAQNSRLTAVGAYAFGSCRYLESFTLPASVTLVGEEAFLDCTRLYEVCNLSPSIVQGETGAHGCLFDHALAVHSDVNAESPFVTTEDGFRFFLAEGGCRLTDYVGEGVIPALPAGIEGRDYAIAPYALHVGTGVEFPAEYQIPKGVTAVGAYAFYGSDFEALTVGRDVQSIGEGAFCLGRRLHTLTFAEESRLTEIAYDAFSTCNALTAVSLPASLRTLGEGAFSSCASLESVVLQGEEVTVIAANTFLGCESLRSFRIHAAVDTVGWNAFGACTSLEEIVLENPEGWVASYEWDTEGEERVVFDAATLSDPTAAARLFSQEYAERDWHRSP